MVTLNSQVSGRQVKINATQSPAKAAKRSDSAVMHTAQAAVTVSVNHTINRIQATLFTDHCSNMKNMIPQMQLN